MRKKKLQRLFAIIAATTVLTTNFGGVIKVCATEVDLQKEYEIYPIPQNIEYENSRFEIGTEVNIVYEDGIDIYTRNRVEEILTSKNISFTVSDNIVDGKTDIIIGINDSEGFVDNYFNKNITHDEVFFEKTDSHLVSVDDGIIGVLGADTDSAFYGVTTLKHVFNQLEDGSISEFRVDDYSDVAQRGFIEGYYGNPWSNEDRAELMKFGGDYKMNQYIFAPKDDPYHNSKWRDLYPEEDLESIKKLAKVGNETKNRYVYALHPFMSNAIRFNTEENYQADLDIIKAKFTQLLEADVRQFAILADDAGVPAQGAGSYVKLLNDLTAWLREMQKTYPDLKDEIVFCPNDYMGNGSSAQLKEVNKAGDNVSIISTGGRIWGEVSESFGRNYKNNIASEGYEGRAPFYWINWPCSDNSKKHLIMGGNDTFLKPGVDPSTIKGIVLNPMQQAEANKSALFANAAYSWNIWDNKEEADQNWYNSFKYMDHGTAEETETSTALRELSKHMINQNMDSRVTKLEESVELAPKLNAFKTKYESGESIKEDALLLIEEFNKLRDAATLYKNEGHERVVSQIVHWLNCWEDTMDAAISYLEALIAVEDGESNDVIWSKYSNGQTAFEKSKTYGFHYVDHTEYAEVGVQHIVPFIKNMAQNLSEIVSSIVDPSKVITTVITNRTDAPTGDLQNLLDNNAATEVIYKTPNTVVAGTYVGVKYNKKIKVKDIHIEMGAASNPRDTMQEAKLQYTEDGKTWVDLSDKLYSMPNQITVEGLDLDVMGIRVIATQDRTNTWLGIKDITINKNDLNQGGGNDSEISATLMRTEGWSVYSGSEANLTDGNDSSSIWYRTHTGDITKVGDYIGLDLGEVTSVGNVHVVVGAGDSDKWTDYKLEYSSDNENWTTFKEYSSTSTKDVIDEDFGGIEARYLRVTNLKQLNKWVKFSEFRVERSTTLPSTNNVYTNVDSGIKSMYVNEALTKLVPQDNITLNEGEYIGIKLNRIRDLSNIDLEVSNMEGLALQTSMNGIEWSDVLDNETLEDARYIRLIANKEVTFNLSKFEVNSNEVYEPSLVSAYADYNANPAVAFDGNFNTSVKYTAAPQIGSTIVYDLGQTVNVNNLKYVVLDTEKDHIRDGKIQLSLDGENWVDAINIENNIPNTSADMDSKPTDNGYIHGSVSGGIIPISHAYMDSGEINQEARYLRVVFTAPYGYRWTVINEFLINNGEYIPTVNDPTFVSDPVEVKGFDPSKAIDGDLTTAYKPNTNKGEITSGSLTYRLSDKTNVKKINIIQSGNEISDAKVMVRVGKDEAGNDIWKQLGTLDKSLNEVINTKYDNIFEIKIEWSGIAPSIYEIITINDYEVPNIGELEAIIDSCNYAQEDYTINSWNAYSVALENAKKVLNNVGGATQESIDKARESLVNTITSLVNISDLRTVIAEADEKVNGEVSYTEDSLNTLKESVSVANEVLANADATVEEVNNAIEDIRNAIDNLVEKEENNPVFNVHLQVAVEEAKKVTEEELSNIVPAVAEEFKAALAESEEILSDKNATQVLVDKLFDRLSKAMQMLSFEKGNKEHLISLVERISGLNGDDYITSTWKKLMTVLGEVNGVISDTNAMEEEVSESYNSLLRAFLELRLKPSKDKLEDLINKAKALDSSKYTVASYRTVEKALNEANEVFANEDASEAEIIKATESLRSAMDGLIANSGSVNNGENSSNSNGTTNGGSNANGGNSIAGSTSSNSQSSNSNKLPQTGGKSAAAVGLFGTIIATIGAVISKKRK